MPTLKLTKSVIDDLKPRATDQVYWDSALPGFGLKITPSGRKVFIVMYRTTDSRRQLRKYTLGTFGGRSEVANMRWDELDLAKGIWTIPANRTKTRRAHLVHLTPQMIVLLPEHEDVQPLVFPSAHGKLYRHFSATKKQHDEISGVRGWVLHDLRRTVATGMARLGVAPHVADKILNHQSGTISGIAAVYQRHEFLVERKAASMLWSSHVEEVLKRTEGKEGSAEGKREVSQLTAALPV